MLRRNLTFVLVVMLLVSTANAFAEQETPPIYLSGKLGFSLMGASDITNTSTVAGGVGMTGAGTTRAGVTKESTSDTVMPIGGAIGYNWAKHGISLRTEMEFLYRTNLGYEANPTFTNSWSPTKLTSKMTSKTVLFNGYYDFTNTTKFTPFVGGGIGFSMNNTKTNGSLTNGTSPAEGTKSKTDFAWNVGGGVAYNLTEHIILDVTYRYADLGKAVWQAGTAQLTSNNLYTNEFLFGARYQF